MRTRMILNGALAAVFTASLLAQPRAAWAADDAVTIYSAGIDGILVDEKDAALRKALHLLDERLAELPEEIGDPSMPPGDIFKMATEMLLGPINLRAGVLEDADPEAGPPFYVQLNVEGANAQAAKGRADAIFNIISELEGPPPNMRWHDQYKDVRVVEPEPEAPIKIYMGSMTVGSRPASVFALNSLSAEAPNLTGFGLPPGAKPAVAMRWNGKRVAPFLEMMLEHAPPGQGEAIRTQLQFAGLIGESPMTFDFAFGHDAEYAHLVGSYSNFRANEGYAMLIAERPLTRSDLNLIPADATIARIGRMKLSAFGDYILSIFRSIPEEEFGGPDPGEIFDMIEQETGINPKTGILDHLGDTWGYYMSDTTGGGGLLSTVIFAAVTNEAALKETFAQITGMVNAMAEENARGYVRFRSRNVGGREFTTLSFPGLPIPLELSCTVSNGYLVSAATPQALVAALDHMEGGGKGLADNPRFTAMAGPNLAKAIDVEWQDTPRLLAGGYGLVSLAMSGINNLIASPKNPDRDAGLILPPLSELAEGAKAAVAVSWIEGDDIRYHARMDRSMLVNLTGAIGSIGGAAPAVGAAVLGAGVGLPAIAKARASALMTRSTTQLRQMHLAAETYRAARGRYPDGFDVLIQEGYIIPGLISSPFGPASDGGPDYWVDFSGAESVDLSWNRIIGYDRAAFAEEPAVPVLLADGRLEVVEIWDFLERTESEPNRGVDFNLPWE